MRDDNYPDDIRQYDSDPRSPFYEEPDEDEAERRQEYEEAKAEAQAEDRLEHNQEWYG